MTFTPESTNYATAKCKVMLTVNKAAPTMTAPTAKTLTYTGSVQELVTGGSTNDGALYYAVTTGNTVPTDEKLYTTSIPAKAEAGTYYVWYKVKGDANHNDSEAAFVKVTIDEKKNVPEIPSTENEPATTESKPTAAESKPATASEQKQETAPSNANRLLNLKGNQTGSKITIKWTRIPDASMYKVYGAYCGKKMKLLKTIKGNGTTKAAFTKLNGKKLNTTKD